jgi:hypothetical protein
MGVSLTDDVLTVELSDGRTISVPLAWYPRLLHARPEERRDWRLIAQGEGIQWPVLDEDISVESPIRGKASSESSASLRRWLAQRARLALALIGVAAASPVVRDARH